MPAAGRGESLVCSTGQLGLNRSVQGHIASQTLDKRCQKCQICGAVWLIFCPSFFAFISKRCSPTSGSWISQTPHHMMNHHDLYKDLFCLYTKFSFFFTDQLCWTSLGIICAACVRPTARMGEALKNPSDYTVLHLCTPILDESWSPFAPWKREVWKEDSLGA